MAGPLSPNAVVGAAHSSTRLFNFTSVAFGGSGFAGASGIDMDMDFCDGSGCGETKIKSLSSTDGKGESGPCTQRVPRDAMASFAMAGLICQYT